MKAKRVYTPSGCKLKGENGILDILKFLWESFWDLYSELGLMETTDRWKTFKVILSRHLENNTQKVVHNSERGNSMVMNSHLRLDSINPLSTNVVMLTSWCKFRFYETDFGFGKPLWVVPGTITLRNSGCLIDDAQGKGVEAYVFLELKDVPDFAELLASMILILVKFLRPQVQKYQYGRM
ncbi:pelargonidin 3-O-(6-caffeoylglucoside) 5-O-(6-O-malonylglucoside) 4'''-malonyltransferase-like protein [Tanacetum coccineum]